MADQSSDQQAETPQDKRIDAAHPVERPASSARVRETTVGSKQVQEVMRDSAGPTDKGPTDTEPVAGPIAGGENDLTSTDMTPPDVTSPDLAPIQDNPVQDDPVQDCSSEDLTGRHVEDLTDRLQARLAELDQRESHLQDQQSKFEAHIRNELLRMDDREAELDGKAEGLIEREKGLGSREAQWKEQFSLANFEEKEEAIRQQEEEVAQAHQRGVELEMELEVAKRELETRCNALDMQSAMAKNKQTELDTAREACEIRQRDLDQREAELHGQAERLTAEKMRHHEKEESAFRTRDQLEERQEQLRDWEHQLGEKASEIEWQRAELAQTAQKLDQRDVQLGELERRLQFRQREIETALHRFEQLGVTEMKLNELDEQNAELAMRGTYLDQAEELLRQQQTQLADDQRNLEQQQIKFQAEQLRERKSQIDQLHEAETKTKQRQQQLDRREAELEQRQAAIDELQEEMGAMQREALEMRLATEETWMQLQGVLTPASLARSVSQTRARLADHFQFSLTSLETGRQEMESVREALAEQHQRIQDRSDQLERWLMRREQDLEQQAARMVAHEQELNRQEQHFQVEQDRWEAERTDYQREIQQLLAKLRHESPVAA